MGLSHSTFLRDVCRSHSRILSGTGIDSSGGNSDPVVGDKLFESFLHLLIVRRAWNARILDKSLSF